jgi:fucose permease
MEINKQLMKNQAALPVSLILLAYIAFISLGLPDGLLGVAWPSVRTNFSRSLDSLGMLMAASMVGYLVSTFYSGVILSEIGVGWLLSLSCGLTGIALLGYTVVPFWWMLIILFVFSGLGAGAIDAGLNTYAAENFGEGLMQWLHASFGIGVTIGPVIMTFGINFFSSWRWGYILVGSAQVALALCFASTVTMWNKKDNKPGEVADTQSSEDTPAMKETLKHLNVWLSALLFFVYSGIESSLGIWSYTLLTESRHISHEAAGFMVGSYWAMFTIGRILAGFFTKHTGMYSLIKISLGAAFIGGVLLIWNPFPLSSLAAVAITGFAIAPMFPGMVSLTERRVSSRYTANTVGIQMSASGIGIAILPGMTGVLAQRTSLEIIPWLNMLWIILLFCIFTYSGRHTIVMKKD